MSVYDRISIIVSGLALVLAAASLINTERRERERIRRERNAEIRERSGRPSTEYLGRNGRAFRFQVTNVGRSHILYFEPFLIDPDDNIVSGDAKRILPGLKPDGQTEFEIAPDTPIEKTEIRLRYEWTDEAGSHEYISNVEIPTN